MEKQDKMYLKFSRLEDVFLKIDENTYLFSQVQYSVVYCRRPYLRPLIGDNEYGHLGRQSRGRRPGTQGEA